LNSFMILDNILEHGIISVVRAEEGGSHVLKAVEAIVEGGVRCIEVTMTTPYAIQTIVDTTKRFSTDEALVGVGTVIDVDDCRHAVQSGARFVVTPAVCLDVVQTARELEVPVLCGAFTPTEVLAAWQHGADLVKIFPASVGGPAYIRALKGPLPQIPMVPTGGVTVENVAAFLEAGAAALAVGGNLATPSLIASGDLPALTQNAREFAAALESARNAH